MWLFSLDEIWLSWKTGKESATRGQCTFFWLDFLTLGLFGTESLDRFPLNHKLQKTEIVNKKESSKLKSLSRLKNTEFPVLMSKLRAFTSKNNPSCLATYCRHCLPAVMASQHTLSPTGINKSCGGRNEAAHVLNITFPSQISDGRNLILL